MDHYSKLGTEPPEKEALARDRFERNLAAFYGGAAAAPDDDSMLEAGATTDELIVRQAADLDAAFAAAFDDDDLTPPTVTAQFAGWGDIEPPERIFEPVGLTHYDKALMRLRAAQEVFDAADRDTAEYHAAASVFAEAKRRLKLEQERAVDDKWRKLRKIEDWRQNEGRTIYNASRRTKRSDPNADLKQMTVEQQNAHRKAQKADSEFKARKKRLGWTPEQIEADLAARREKRGW